MGDAMSPEPRRTQRPPRSCLRCARSKIRCDKSLPCLQCRSRGLGAQCRVETVRVHGRTHTGSEDHQPEPSYADLIEENKRLRAQVSRLSGQSRNAVEKRPLRITGKNEELLYQRLRRETQFEPIWHISQVLFPSEASITACLAHAARWTWWLHGAVDPESLEHEIKAFYSAGPASHLRALNDPAQSAWLGVFFSYITIAALFMTDEELLQSSLPNDDPILVIRNWYHSALFFLYESQFLRILDVRNVQTIVILGTCSIHFGDFNVYYNLWGCALRIAQSLGISPDHKSLSENASNDHMHLSLWAALMTNDWLQIPLQSGHSGFDRDSAGVEFPECAFPQLENSSTVQPLYYQFILAKLSLTLRKFYEGLVAAGDDFEILGFALASADRDLAAIVSQLPEYLQPEPRLANEFRDREEANPWLSWQRENLCIILLYYRLVIYRPLCDERNNDTGGREKASHVCLDAAHGILASIDEFDSGEPILRRRLVWYQVFFHRLGHRALLIMNRSFLLPVFTAAATLLTSQDDMCRCGTTSKHRDETMTCLRWFDQAAERSHYAASAARFLRELPSDPPQS